MIRRKIESLLMISFHTSVNMTKTCFFRSLFRCVVVNKYIQISMLKISLWFLIKWKCVNKTEISCSSFVFLLLFLLVFLSFFLFSFYIITLPFNYCIRCVLCVYLCCIVYFINSRILNCKKKVVNAFPLSSTHTRQGDWSEIAYLIVFCHFWW